MTFEEIEQGEGGVERFLWELEENLTNLLTIVSKFVRSWAIYLYGMGCLFVGSLVILIGYFPLFVNQ